MYGFVPDIAVASSPSPNTVAMLKSVMCAWPRKHTNYEIMFQTACSHLIGETVSWAGPHTSGARHRDTQFTLSNQLLLLLNSKHNRSTFALLHVLALPGCHHRTTRLPYRMFQNYTMPQNNSSQTSGRLTLILLTWSIWWAPNNASRWQMGFNSAFKGLKMEGHCSLRSLEPITRCCSIIPHKHEVFDHLFSVVQKPAKIGPRRLIFEVSSSRTIKHTHLAGLFWTSEERFAEAATYIAHSKHNRRTSTPSAGFEPTIAAIKRLHT